MSVRCVLPPAAAAKTLTTYSSRRRRWLADPSLAEQDSLTVALHPPSEHQIAEDPDTVVAWVRYAFLRGNELGRRDHSAQKLVSQYRDFDDFVARWLHPETIHRQLHFTPQTNFLIDSLGHLALDFIGYQEHLQRDFGLVCERLGHEVLLPHINGSQQRRPVPARDFCSTRTRRLVRRVYQRDYEMLGYE